MIKLRKIAYNRFGGLDCEVNFGKGWGPYTLSPDDPEQVGRDLYARAKKMVIGPYVPLSGPEILRVERLEMVVSVRQARIILGPVVCASLDTMAGDDRYPWALRQTLSHSTDWRRKSQEADEIAWALGYDGDQMDKLFRKAVNV